MNQKANQSKDFLYNCVSVLCLVAISCMALIVIALCTTPLLDLQSYYAANSLAQSAEIQPVQFDAKTKALGGQLLIPQLPAATPTNSAAMLELPRDSVVTKAIRRNQAEVNAILKAKGLEPVQFASNQPALMTLVEKGAIVAVQAIADADAEAFRSEGPSAIFMAEAQQKTPSSSNSKDIDKQQKHSSDNSSLIASSSLDDRDAQHARRYSDGSGSNSILAWSAIRPAAGPNDGRSPLANGMTAPTQFAKGVNPPTRVGPLADRPATIRARQDQPSADKRPTKSSSSSKPGAAGLQMQANKAGDDPTHASSPTHPTISKTAYEGGPTITAKTHNFPAQLEPPVRKLDAIDGRVDHPKILVDKPAKALQKDDVKRGDFARHMSSSASIPPALADNEQQIATISAPVEPGPAAGKANQEIQTSSILNRVLIEPEGREDTVVLRRLASQGDSAASARLAEMASDAGHWNEAFTLYRRSADQRSAKSAYIAGYMLGHWEDLLQNPARNRDVAIYYLRMAADSADDRRSASLAKAELCRRWSVQASCPIAR